ncbi:hypothetical protein QBC44DRAFT_364457 [Cladorrhinum sp. PSN332]|nr:hypothetical protein QBC44DRAFT_364457 [Cladorrhinum sp. PSN332]
MMFEVDWSDFGSERVGQRRARKGNDHEIKKQESHNTTAVTSNKIPASEGKPALSLFGSIGLKRNSLSLRSNKKKGLSSIDVTKEDAKPKRRSLLSPRSATASTFSATPRSSILSNNSFTLPTSGSNDFVNGMPAEWEDHADRSSKESMMSKSTCITIPTLGPQSEGSTPSQATPGTKLVQSLDDASSCVMRTIKTTYEDSFKSVAGDETVGVGTKIVAESLKSQAPTHSPSPSSATASSCRNKPLSVSGADQETQDKSVGEVLLPPNGNSAPSSSGTPSNSTKHKYTATPSPTHLNLRVNSAAAWKPPDNWKAPSPLGAEPQTPRSTSRNAPVMSETMYEATLEAMAIQRETKRVGFATPQVILARLNEDWGTAADPMIFKQLETEKKRWMLSAMHRLGRDSKTKLPAVPATSSTPSTPCTPCFPDTTTASGTQDTQDAQDTLGATEPPKPFLGSMKPFLKGPKVLSLYDSQSTTAYLAALHPNNTITHLAPLPLHNLLYPNIRPLYSAVTSSLSFSDNSYISVHSLSMPALLAGQEVPRLLKGIRRCLASKGILHMTLIDPSPASRSLGPRMREWLDQNLIVHLESEFRCISPSRLFPKWLVDARLCGEGSSVTRAKFPAVFHQHLDGQINGAQEGESPIETELQSVVGRMLWQEVWGKAVRGNSWWWEDSECVSECIKHGTFFEYFLIEAVKQD